MTTGPDNPIVYFAKTDFRHGEKKFGIKRYDRRAHMYVIGKTGTGKSTLLETMILQDIESGQGLALLDPHGDLVEKIAAKIPERRKNDLIYFDVPDDTKTFGFNPLEQIDPQKRPFAAAGLLEAFKKLWSDSWGPRLEHILRNALLALLDQPEATLPDVLKLLENDAFRRSVALRVHNLQVRGFWLREYESYPARFRVEAIAPIQNKVGAFLSDPRLYRILAQPKSSFNLRKMMDEGKILLVNLSKGKIGEDTAALLGALLVTSLGLAALSRADIPEESRRDFYLYIDEFQSFTTLSLTKMLSELRKFRMALILGHQYLAQLDEQIRDAVLGNIGTLISFRVGMSDAEILGKEFYPAFSAGDLIRLSNHRIYIKLMIDGMPSEPFSAETIKLPTIKDADIIFGDT